MAEAGAGFLEQLKSCIVWSWTYLWTVWFFLVLFLVYILRVPLRINDNLSTVSMFLNTLTPKFYVALTGTSSLISGLILIFEWWYFRKYGTSFIEQVSVSHLRPLLGGVDNNSSNNSNSSNGDSDSNRQSVSDIAHLTVVCGEQGSRADHGCLLKPLSCKVRNADLLKLLCDSSLWISGEVWLIT